MNMNDNIYTKFADRLKKAMKHAGIESTTQLIKCAEGYEKKRKEAYQQQRNHFLSREFEHHNDVRNTNASTTKHSEALTRAIDHAQQKIDAKQRIIEEASFPEYKMAKFPNETVYKWLRQGNNDLPKVSQLITLCEILDVDPQYLLGQQETRKRENANIHDETGLSEDAIDIMRKAFTSNPTKTKLIETFILECDGIAKGIDFIAEYNSDKDYGEVGYAAARYSINQRFEGIIDNLLKSILASKDK